MSAKVIHLDRRETLRASLQSAMDMIDTGAVIGFAMVAELADGGVMTDIDVGTKGNWITLLAGCPILTERLLKSRSKTPVVLPPDGGGGERETG